tara:strand:- start:37553 stop:39100 length:1548 start_codon:yes stop_codon:yes gene_type:complete
MSDLSASIIIKAVDRLTGPIKRMTAGVKKSFSNIGGELKNLGKGLGNIAGETLNLGFKLASTAGVIGYAFKRMFVDTAAQFEKFQTILETTEGSSNAAKKAMEWVSDFATKAPFELDQVTGAFVKLRAYGLDPTNGLLTTLGDTSSAMGKDLMQAVEAIADAVTGENERLKEFGIKAGTSGNKVRYEFTNKNGEQKSLIVNKNDRKAIEDALKQIFNEKYTGSMDRLSKTWTGLISNISDQWTRFVNLVMKNGVFDLLKGQLSGVLDKINELAESGKLDEIARLVGQKITRSLKSFARVMKQDVWPMIKMVGRSVMWLHDLFGSWKPVIAGIAAILAGPLLLAIVSTAAALASLGLALWANPLVLAVVAASAAIGAAVYLVYKHWEPIKEFFSKLWSDITSGFKMAVDVITKIFEYSPIGLIIKGVGELRGIYNDIKPQQRKSVTTYAEKTSVRRKRKDNSDSSEADSSSLFEKRSGAKYGRSSLAIEVHDKRIQVKSIESNSMDISVDTGMVTP